MSHTHHIDRPDGTRIAYSVSGAANATPLILSNSLATDAQMWEKVLPALQQKYRVITYDTRGHGQSVCATASPTLSDLAADLAAVLDAAGAPRALMAGVSLGGMTGMTGMAGMGSASAAYAGEGGMGDGAAESAKFCSIDNPECEACQ